MLSEFTAPGTGSGTPRTDKGPLLADTKVRERYGVTTMTLWRWDHSPELEFPAPIVISGRKYRFLQELIEWESQRAKASVSTLAKGARQDAAAHKPNAMAEGTS